MPYNRRRRYRLRPRRIRRPRLRRTFRRRFRRMRKSRIPGVMPSSYMTKMRYAVTLSFHPTVPDTMAYYCFRANDVFDPEYAIGGHSAMGFDELMPFYRFHTVVGSRITVTPQIVSTAALVPQVYGLALSDITDDLAPLSYHALLENDSTSKRRIYNATHQQTVGLQSVMRRVPHMNFSLGKWFKTKDKMDPIYAGEDSSSPTEQVLYWLWAYLAPGATGEPVDTVYTIQLEYIVVWHEMKHLPTSGEDLASGRVAKGPPPIRGSKQKEPDTQ